MKLDEAEATIAKKVHRFMVPRALDMFRHMVDCRTTISHLRIAKNWPMDGIITFRRDADGKSVRLFMQGDKFIGTAE